MRYLGLDVGERWIGLAVGDAPSGRLQYVPTTPLRTLRRSSRAADLAALRRVCDAEGIDTIVVGLPRNMDGSLGPQAQRTLAFTQALQSLGLPIVFSDERLSSVAAEEYVTATRGRRPRPDERLDHVAAAIILQDYLNSMQ